MSQLQGLTAVVTGSTSGIGLAIAERLVADGCNLVLNGFGDADEIERQRGRLEQSASGRVIYHGADIAEPDQVADMVAIAEETFGGLDVLVNNAGIQFTANVEEFPVEKWQAILSINLSGAFYAIRAALPGMKQRNFGRIVNVASAHGLVASPQKAAYVAAKHGLVGLTKVVALETAPLDITCNALCPGWVETPLVQGQIQRRAEANGSDYGDEAKALVREKQPNERFITAPQLAEFVAFLSRREVNTMTGTALAVDGGWTAQ
ncbi:MAG: 3-hydroxybutyrate dehydrogenase [Candidatus Competibacterales bacterium]